MKAMTKDQEEIKEKAITAGLERIRSLLEHEPYEETSGYYLALHETVSAVTQLIQL